MRRLFLLLNLLVLNVLLSTTVTAQFQPTGGPSAGGVQLYDMIEGKILDTGFHLLLLLPLIQAMKAFYPVRFCLNRTIQIHSTPLRLFDLAFLKLQQPNYRFLVGKDNC